jgi:hypothetical protein
MRAIRSAVLAILVVAVIGALACSSDGTGMSRRAGLEALETNAVAVADADDAFANVHDATVDAPMSMDAVVSGPDWRHDVHPQLPGSHLGPILRELEITREQLRQILGFVVAHWTRVERAFAGIREVNSAIIAEANVIRERIVHALHNGDITREEAERRLRGLNMRIREAIRNNPANEVFKRVICESKIHLLRSVRSVLEPRQQAAWDRWVASLDGPCFHD